jgi:hypothetical protein
VPLCAPDSPTSTALLLVPWPLRPPAVSAASPPSLGTAVLSASPLVEGVWLSFQMTITDSLPRQARDTQTHAKAHTTPGASFRTHRGGSPTNVNPPLDREIQDPIGRLLASKTSTEPVSCVKNGLFWSFPYVCPEPVLVKCSFAYINVKRIVLTSFRFEFSSLRIIPSLSW